MAREHDGVINVSNSSERGSMNRGIVATGGAIGVAFLLLFPSCMESVDDRIGEEKSALRQQLQQSINDINVEIHRLKRDQAGTQGESRITLQKRVAGLEELRSDLCDRITDLGDATLERWSVIRAQAARSLMRARTVLRGRSSSPRMVYV